MSAIELRAECGDLWRYPEDVTQESFTTDCTACGALLIMVDGKLLFFHKYLNSKNLAWPIDGKDTGYIELA